ncbi:MAG: post-PEP-CTERM-1 domain-containing protein [Luteimonas sp.]
MRYRTTLWLLLASLTLVGAAHAGELAAQSADETPVYFNGVKVAIDPATGKLRQPTAAEIQALRAVIAPDSRSMSIGKPMPQSQAASNATYRKLKNGGVMVQLPESSMTSLVAVRQADGTLRISDGDSDGRAITQEAASE